MSNMPTDHLDVATLNASIKSAESLFVLLIRRRLGISIHQHQMNALDKTIAAACQKFHCTPQSYLELLTDCPNDAPPFVFLVAGITIGETYFFRDKNQMNLLEHAILPKLIKQKRAENNLSLRFWSAGCASGEEIYTLAILLQELLPDISLWNLHLLGSDINAAVLQKASRAEYSEWSMRSIPDYYKNTYFSEKKRQFYLNSTVRDMVEFMYLNLNDDLYPSIMNGTNAQDLILCRNVLIYFEQHSIAQVMRKLSLSLTENGYLLLGASDPINIANTDLVFHHQEGILFTKSSAMEIPTQQVNEPIPKRTIRTSAQTKVTAGTMTHAAQAINTLDEAKINQLMQEGHWQELLDAMTLAKTSVKKSLFIMNAEATALANLGKLTQAAAFCRESLAVSPTQVPIYFMLAMILVELKKLPEAEEALRKTLFLDHQFVAGHFQLGLLLLRTKHYKAGMKSLQNALSIVSARDPSQTAIGFQELKYGQLTEILKQEINLHSVGGDNANNQA